MLYVAGNGPLSFTIAATFSSHDLVTLISNGDPGYTDEPHLAELVNAGLNNGTISLQSNIDRLHTTDYDVLWIAYDTPVDSSGQANVNSISEAYIQLIEKTSSPSALVLISSQVPVGFTRRLASIYQQMDIAVIPENLRRGHAINDFAMQTKVIGTLTEQVGDRVSNYLKWYFCDPFVLVSPETAEMSKHALNSFLAMNIAFANEMSEFCLLTGANWSEIQTILKMDPRVGANAYLRDGPADGRHLLRDVNYLLDIAKEDGPSARILSQIVRSEAWES